MTEPGAARSERYLRYSQRGMILLLFVVVAIGATYLAVALRPDGTVSRWMPHVSSVLPVIMTILVGALLLTLRPGRWDPKAPEARALMQDEWRRTNLDRALRAAFIVVLVAQVPIGMLLSHLPSMRAVMAMAVSTLTLGMATLIALFLFFSREERSE